MQRVSKFPSFSIKAYRYLNNEILSNFARNQFNVKIPVSIQCFFRIFLISLRLKKQYTVTNHLPGVWWPRIGRSRRSEGESGHSTSNSFWSSWGRKNQWKLRNSVREGGRWAVERLSKSSRSRARLKWSMRRDLDRTCPSGYAVCGRSCAIPLLYVRGQRDFLSPIMRTSVCLSNRTISF